MTQGPLGAIHARLGRAVITIYLCAAGLAIALLVVLLATDLNHQEESARDNLLLQTEARAHYLGRELGLLAGELRRLGLRSEVNLLDQNMEPERSLLRLSHEKSTFFNVGVAILDGEGVVQWSEPNRFLTVGTKLGKEPWFRAAQVEKDVRIVPVSPESPSDSLVYLVSPVVRNGQFSGALVGAIDLAVGGELDPSTHEPQVALTVLATHAGVVVYPPKPPGFAADQSWARVFEQTSWEPFVTGATLAGQRRVIAGDAVPASDLELLSVAREDELFGPARARLTARLVFGLVIALVPTLALVLLLRRTLRAFRESQEQVSRDERMRQLGEAANLIAHEIKNSLNGMQMGLDVMLRQDVAKTKESASVGALRSEIARLSGFTTELLTFSKGVVPRPAPMDLAAFVRKLSEISKEQAAEAQVTLDVEIPAGEIKIRADSSLIHVVLSNLIGNAIDALAARRGTAPTIAMSVGASGAAWVRVSDNGPGVPESVRKGLFEPFVTGKPSGVGIGLALSRKIARAHGGDLVLEPSEVGASFLLTLPALPPAQKPGRASHETPAGGSA